MKKMYSIIILLVSSILLIFTPNQKVLAKDLNEEQIEFINSIKDEALVGYKESNILPSLTIAQAILESSWGKSGLTVKANNLFGVKAYSDWTGESITLSTKEYTSDGDSYTIDAQFKVYPTLSDSIKDHNELLSTDRYEKVRSANSYIDACNAILECGYATSPSYSEMLIEIIENYNLNQYDNPDLISNYGTDLVTENSNTEENHTINDKNESKKESTQDNNKLTDPILLTAIDKKYKNISIFEYGPSKDDDNTVPKEDTNNIPSEIAHQTLSNQNYWYVIYCLLQNYYPDVVK